MRPALGLVLLALLAGCGNDDEETAGAPRREDFVSQVDALCRSANPKLASIQAEILRARDDARAGRAAPQETFATFEALLERARAVSDRLVIQLRRIAPPAEEEEFHAALVDSLEAGAANVGRQVNAAHGQDAAALRELSVHGSRLNTRSKGLIQGHGGFRHCGRA
jgi:hypothetical protein